MWFIYLDMDSTFTIRFKKQSKGKKKKRVNVFGDPNEDEDNSLNRVDSSSSIAKNKKIRLTEITADDLVPNQEKTESQKPTLVIKLDHDDLSHPTQEVTTMDEYNSVPVELFGEALLRGMGWDGELVDGNGNGNEEMSSQNDVTKLKHPDNVGIGATKSNIQVSTSNFMPIKKIEKSIPSNLQQTQQSNEKEEL